jgi:hypothetical protein
MPTKANKFSRTMVAIFSPILFALGITCELLVILLGTICMTALTAVITGFLVVVTLLAILVLTLASPVHIGYMLWKYIKTGESSWIN